MAGPESTRVTDLLALLPVQLLTVKGVADHPAIAPLVMDEYREDGKVITILEFAGIEVDGWNSIVYTAVALISVGLADMESVNPYTCLRVSLY
jgi:hypothetical protein